MTASQYEVTAQGQPGPVTIQLVNACLILE